MAIDYEKIEIDEDDPDIQIEYAEAPGVDNATNDWVRAKNNIFVNGLSVKEITDDLRVKRLNKSIEEFLANAGSEEDKLERVSALTEIFQKITGNNDFNPEQISHAATKALLDKLEEQRFADDYTQTVDGNEVSHKAFDLSSYELTPNQGMDKLKEMLVDAYQFFRQKNEESVETLKRIWNKYLLANVQSPQEKEQVINQLFKFAHQGGILFSLLTPHIMHATTSGQHVIVGADARDHARIDFRNNGKDNRTEIVEVTPIRDIHLAMNAAKSAFPDKHPKDDLLRLELKHVITSSDEAATMHREYARETVFSNEARDILWGRWTENPEWEAQATRRRDLVKYAKNYIQHGHNDAMIKELHTKYPDLEKTVASQDIHYLRMNSGGDKILTYVGDNYPGFVAAQREDAKQYKGKSDTHIGKIANLMRHMGRSDIGDELTTLARDRRRAEGQNVLYGALSKVNRFAERSTSFAANLFKQAHGKENTAPASPSDEPASKKRHRHRRSTLS